MAFIAFEGLDGSGKSTLIKGLGSYLESGQVTYKVTREPGGTDLGEEVRQLLLRTKGEAPTPKTELLLYEAGRSQHVEKVIRPHLDKGDWVLCDRYYASTLAFQAGGRSLNPEPINWLNEYATGGLAPDLWVLLDLSIEESEKRMGKRESEGQEKDRFESEKKEFHQKVRDYYLKLAKEDSKKWLVLDASLSAEDLLSQLIEKLKENQWLSF